MVIVDILKADVERARLNGSTECNEYERNAEKRSVPEEIHHRRLALFRSQRTVTSISENRCVALNVYAVVEGIMMQGAGGVPFVDPFAVMNTIGLIAFALVGSAKAIREEFDLFGITVVGLTMAFAGGVTRDLLVNRVPLALQSPIEISLGLLGVGLAVGLSVVLDSPDDHPIVLLSDAVGLAAFATTGAIVATNTGVSAFGVVAVATINAVGGGAFADILLDRSPFILLDDFYASCAVLGGSVYWFVVTAGGAEGTASALCAVVTVGIRLAAINYGWGLPKAQILGLAREEGDDNR